MAASSTEKLTTIISDEIQNVDKSGEVFLKRDETESIMVLEALNVDCLEELLLSLQE